MCKLLTKEYGSQQQQLTQIKNGPGSAVQSFKTDFALRHSFLKNKSRTGEMIQGSNIILPQF